MGADGLDVRDVTLSASSRDDVFAQLAALVGADPAAIVSALMAREADGGTAVGPNVAMPHASIAGLDHGVLLDVRLSHDLAWDGAHNEIRRCFCVLVPEDHPDEHTTLLAEAARRAIAGPLPDPPPRARRASTRTRPLYGLAVLRTTFNE